MQCLRCIVGRRVALFRDFYHGREAFRRPRRAPRRSGAAHRARPLRRRHRRFPARCMPASCAARMPTPESARSTPSAARAMPGVHAVLTADDLPPRMATGQIPMLVPNPSIKTPRTQLALARARGLLCRPDHRGRDRGEPLPRRGRGRGRRRRFRSSAGGERLPRRRQARAPRARTATSRATSPPSSP